MKKLFYSLLMAGLTFSFTAYSEGEAVKAESQIESHRDNSAATDSLPADNTLIVYYSFTNNIQKIVSDLQTQIDADVLRVEPAEEGIDYAADNYAAGSSLISAIRENPEDASSYPDIRTTIGNLDEYDTVIVAAPLWWSSMAAPMQTFLFKYGSQMSEKHIGLIVSSASTGISGVEADLRRLVPDGDFIEPSLWIRSSQTSDCHSMVADWLEEIHYGASK